MIEITYLDTSKQERTMTFESYEDFERSQQACLIGGRGQHDAHVESGEGTSGICPEAKGAAIQDQLQSGRRRVRSWSVV